MCTSVPLCPQVVCTPLYAWVLAGRLLDGPTCLSRSRPSSPGPLCAHNPARVQASVCGQVSGSQHRQAWKDPSWHLELGWAACTGAGVVIWGLSLGLAVACLSVCAPVDSEDLNKMMPEALSW